MRPTRRPESPGWSAWLRSHGSLLLGCLAGGALIVLARSPLLKRDGAIDQEIELITRSVSAEVQRAWESDGFRPAQEPLASCPTVLPDFDPAHAQELGIPEAERTSAFDILLAESERAEFAGEDRRALRELEDARARTDDPRRWILADLRMVQLAAKLGDGAILAEALNRLRERLDGTEALHGVSVLLTAFSAAALSPAERNPLLQQSLNQLDARLAAALRAGRLALPPITGDLLPGPDGPTLRLDSARAQYLDACRRYAGEAAVAAEQRLASDRIAWLAARFGPLDPMETAQLRRPVAAADRAAPESDDELLLLAPASAAGVLAWVLPRPSWEDALRARWRELGLIPAGVQVALLARGARAESRALHGTPFAVAASLANPAAYRERARSAFRWLRILLHALGAMCVLLGVAVQRQRSRELAVQRLKTEFVASVSHELRTPLSSILLMAENLRAGKVSEPAQQRYHELILRESQRLRRLVDDVLDFSRLERGEGPRARLEPISVAAFAEELRADLQAWAAQHEVEVRFGGLLATEAAAAAREAGTAPLDREALRRALLNLADNARRHANAQKLDVDLEADQQGLVLSCRDHGPGLPPGTEERVFQPFEQLAPGSTRGKGAGLGLAVVAEIARAHGGRASASNHPGGGAAFRLTLPRPSQT